MTTTSDEDDRSFRHMRYEHDIAHNIIGWLRVFSPEDLDYAIDVLEAFDRAITERMATA